jgi:hypothetical protein
VGGSIDGDGDDTLADGDLHGFGVVLCDKSPGSNLNLTILLGGGVARISGSIS